MLCPMSALLIGYAVVVCLTLICSSTIFSVRLSTSTTKTALQISSVSLMRNVQSTALSLDVLKDTSSRVGFALQHTASSASLHRFHSPLKLIDDAFQILRPSKKSFSLIAQDEVWWSAADGAFVTVGCYRHGTKCYRSNGTVTQHLTSAFPDTPLRYEDVRMVSKASQYYGLHQRMLRQPQFTQGKGMWTPRLARYTSRSDAIPCGQKFIEYIMAYYDCLEFQPTSSSLPPPPQAQHAPLDPDLRSDGGYCTHAVVSIVDLMRRSSHILSGFSTESKVMVQSLRVMDEVNNQSCTHDEDERVKDLLSVPVQLSIPRDAASGEWVSAMINGGSVVTNALLMRDDGVLIAYRDVTPKRFFFATAQSDCVVGVVVTLAILAVVSSITFFMWYRVTRPLQRVCRSMRETTTGILQGDATTCGGGRDDDGCHDASNRRSEIHLDRYVLVKEVLELYESYHHLRVALSRLRAFAPQGMFVLEREATAAASPLTTIVSSSSSWDVHEEDERVGEREEEEELPVQQEGLLQHYETPAYMMAGFCMPATTCVSCVAREMSARESAITTAAAPAMSSASSAAETSVRVPLRPPQHPSPSTCSRGTDIFTRRPPLRTAETSASACTTLPLGGSSTTSALTPASAVHNGDVTRRDSTTLARTTSFRTVNCTTLTISYHYAMANLELECTEIGSFLTTCIDLITAHSGTVEVLRPEVLVVSFGAHRDDPLHISRALRCAVQIFSRFTPKQKQRASLLLDTGNVYVGTCGAHNRYARVITGDRIDFVMRVRQHGLSVGRIITTDSIALPWHTRRYVFLPFDNIVPRSDDGVSRTSTLLFQLLPKERLTPANRQLTSAYHQVFVNAVNGLYEVALTQLCALPSFDRTVRAAFIGALQTILATSPRRPRYCRFELPPFETLGFTAGPLPQLHSYKPLLPHDLEPPLPRISFLSSNEPCLSTTASLEEARGGSSPPPPSQHAPQPQQQQQQREWRTRSPLWTSSGLGGGYDNGNGVSPSCVSLDNLCVSSEADSFICGDPSPHTFRDSKGEEWTLMPDCVGRGAFSEVYKAFSSDGIIMAVKCIQLARRDVRASDVVDEVNTSCQLWNEHIVNCTSWARVGTYLFIVMELLAGGSLHDTLRHFPHGLSNTVARRYGSDVLRGLSYLHRHGIVHADVKPQNMLLATDGGCRISDFGSSVTQLSGVVVFSKDVHQLRGTPLYMSPEVACGEPPTVKSDVWSFGLSLYEMLTGHLPWVWQSTGRLVYPSQEEQRDSISSSFRPPFAQQQRQLQQHLLQPASPPPPLCSGNGTLCLPPLSVHSSGAEEAAHAARQAHSLPQMCSPPPSAIAQVSLNAQGASLSPTAVAVSPVKAPTAPGFLQSVIRGDIVARVDRREFTSQDAIQVVEACLRGNPAERPTIDELLFMTFFSTLR